MTGNIINGISIPIGDTHFADHLRAGPLFNGRGTYQFAKIERTLATLNGRPCRVAIDVGAHVGLWTRVLAHHFGRVVALEPMPHLLPHFWHNVSDCDNVRLIEAAVSDDNGDVDLVSVTENSGNGRVRAANEPRGVMTYTVQGVCIDSLNIHDVDLIKIDVEGWELQVVKGAFKTIRQFRPVIVVEQKPGHAERYGADQLAAVRQFEAWGYRQAWSKAGDYCMIHDGAAE